MSKKVKMKFRDPCVESVCKKLVLRSNVGIKKYGVTLDKERRSGIKDVYDYLNDMSEELMDAVLYTEAAIDAMDAERHRYEETIDRLNDEIHKLTVGQTYS